MVDLYEKFRDHSDRVRKVGHAFSPTNPDNGVSNTNRRRHLRIDVPNDTFPRPSIARSSLLILGCKDIGRSEKVAWRVPFDFEGIRFGLEHQKLGINLHMWFPAELTDDEAHHAADRAISALGRVIRVVEKDILPREIEAEVSAHKITLQNNLAPLRASYQYLRTLAETKAVEEVPPLELSDDLSFEERMHRVFEQHGSERQIAAEHSYLADSTVIAFFAYLERFVTLALPFSRANIDDLDVEEFISSGWATKYKVVLDLKRSVDAQRYFDQLIRVAERVRNPRAHGHDKHGSTTSVFIEGVGQIPLAIANGDNGNRLRLGSIGDGAFDKVVALFDEVEEFLHGAAMGNAGRWLSSGFDVPFYGDAIDAFRAPSEVFEKFLEREIDSWERAVNMDW